MLMKASLVRIIDLYKQPEKKTRGKSYKFKGFTVKGDVRTKKDESTNYIAVRCSKDI